MLFAYGIKQVSSWLGSYMRKSRSACGWWSSFSCLPCPLVSLGWNIRAVKIIRAIKYKVHLGVFLPLSLVHLHLARIFYPHQSPRNLTLLLPQSTRQERDLVQSHACVSRRPFPWAAYTASWIFRPTGNFRHLYKYNPTLQISNQLASSHCRFKLHFDHVSWQVIPLKCLPLNLASLSELIELAWSEWNSWAR